MIVQVQAQNDSLYLYSTGQKVIGDSIFLPTSLYKRGAIVPKLLKIKLRKTQRIELNMGMDAAYIPETDVQGGNATRSKSAILVYQLPISIQVSQGKLDSISNYIKQITEPTNLPPPPKPDVETFIDDKPTETANKYIPATGVWTHAANQSWNANHKGSTASYTLLTTGVLEVTFDGYKFEWWSERRLNHGIASIQIDSQTPVKVDLYEKRTDNNSLLVYSSPILSSGTHKITLKMTGDKNPAWSIDYPAGTAAQNQLRTESQQNNIIHDAFKVYKKQ